MILLDSDRLQADLRVGRDPRVLEGIVPLVWLRPNLEGLLVRLHEGHEKRDIQPTEAYYELQQLWPGYEKSVSANALYGRFGLNNLRRAARHDEQLRRMLELLSID